jgi:uncharacterized membrane protein
VAAVAKLEAAKLARRTRPELFADAIARMAGTPRFAALHVVWFALWILRNLGLGPAFRTFDPFPFSFDAGGVPRGDLRADKLLTRTTTEETS